MNTRSRSSVPLYVHVRTPSIRLAVALCIFAAMIFLSCIDRDGPAVGPGGNIIGDDGSASAVYLGDPPVLFSEVYTANPDYKDEFGGDPGWVEFYNPSDAAVDLKGYYLTDDAGAAPARWAFGDVVVPPRGYLVVFMSGRDIPDYYPPSDSIDILGKAAGTWAWADSQAAPVAGKSAAYSTFSRNPPGFSGTLKARDNSSDWQTPNALGWTSAVAMLVLNDWDTSAVIDMSRANQVVLKGFVNKNSKLEARFVSPGTADWLAWPAVITGTGIENDLYMITLPRVEDGYPDLANIYGIRFSNAGSFRGTIEFDFNSITAYRRATNVHVSFSLANKGGRLFLTDGGGNIRDSVAYPASTLELSYARNLETLAWAHSRPPTPGGMNSAETYEGGQVGPPPAAGIPNSGHYSEPFSFTIPQGESGAAIVCDMTGALPEKDGAPRSGSVVNLTKTTAMRCAQFKDGAYQSDPIMRTYVIGRLPDLPIVSVVVNPHDMFDSTRGLYATGPNASGIFPYNGANFWADTELPVQIEFFERNMRHDWTSQAGLRIFGNWSRGCPKKSVLISFRDIYGNGRLTARLLPEHPTLTRFKHFILRNNGNNFDQDYIRDMLMSSLTEGLDIDYQRGRAVIVYYNGEYFGIHNLRERANGDYFETKYGDGYSQDFIDLVKASGEVSEGSDADYKDIVSWLEGLNGLSDDNLRRLEERIDADNFTYNFMTRMYYHDRDWPGNNMKRWRRHSPASRWKWFMYDTDHGWGSHGQWEQQGVSTMDFVTAANGPDWPNPPHSTFLFRKLLQNEGYKRSFINRFSLLMATYYADDRVNARIDALMTPIESEIPHDQARWNHNVTRMNTEMNAIRNFNSSRKTVMRSEIEQFFGLGAGVDFSVSVGGNGNGSVRVHNMEVLGGGATFKAYPGVPMVLKAVPGSGASFENWSDGIKEAERTVTVTAGQPVTLQAIFAGGGISVKERDRVIPEGFR